MNKTAKKHLDAIKAGEVTRGNIIGLRKLINASNRAAYGFSTSKTACVVSGDELGIIENAIAEHMPRAVGEIHDSGVALMRNKRYVRQLPDSAQRVAQFRLARYDYIGRTGLHCVPVWRAYDSTGGYLFTYRCVPWQSGGNGPEIV